MSRAESTPSASADSRTAADPRTAAKGPRREEPPLSFSTKVKAGHLSRKAIVYVRQSTTQQVLNHRESTARQYALDRRAVQLGWPDEAVITVDEDQGRSGQTAEGAPALPIC